MKKENKLLLVLFTAMSIFGFLMGTAVGLAAVNKGSQDVPYAYLLLGGALALLPVLFVTAPEEKKRQSRIKRH